MTSKKAGNIEIIEIPTENLFEQAECLNQYITDGAKVLHATTYGKKNENFKSYTQYVLDISGVKPEEMALVAGPTTVKAPITRVRGKKSVKKGANINSAPPSAKPKRARLQLALS